MVVHGSVPFTALWVSKSTIEYSMSIDPIMLAHIQKKTIDSQYPVAVALER